MLTASSWILESNSQMNNAFWFVLVESTATGIYNSNFLRDYQISM